jgi:16S rRNA (cytosine1402-N4)-methyltransferase
MIHTSVLVNEVLEYLKPQPDENMVDATTGEGGHTRLLLEGTAPRGKVLGIDADTKQVENARRNLVEFSERLVLTHDSYAHIKEIIEKHHFRPVNGILLDLGYSSWQMEASGKGFSFLKDEPLDMRYGNGELTAEQIVNEWPEEKIRGMIEEFGEEHFAKQIARAMVRQRKSKKIESTLQLVKIIEEAVGAKYRGERIHYATRTFQALRIAVNGELDNLQAFLPQAVEVLASGGRLAIISFHSLEDRIVKNFFKNQENIHILTNKPVTASDEEIASNPRARSAKLRAIQKI